MPAWLDRLLDRFTDRRLAGLWGAGDAAILDQWSREMSQRISLDILHPRTHHLYWRAFRHWDAERIRLEGS